MKDGSGYLRPGSYHCLPSHILGDDKPEPVEVDGLCDMGIHACIEGGPLVILKCIGGHRYDGNGKCP